MSAFAPARFHFAVGSLPVAQERPCSVFTAGDHVSDSLAERHFAEVPLNSMRTPNNGAEAIASFAAAGASAIMILPTSVVHAHLGLVEQFGLRAHLATMNYMLMSAKPEVPVAEQYPGLIVGGVFAPMGQFATHLVGAAEYRHYCDPKDATQDALDGKLDLICKPVSDQICDEVGLRPVCDITAMSGIEVRFYLLDKRQPADGATLAGFLAQDRLVKSAWGAA